MTLSNRHRGSIDTQVLNFRAVPGSRGKEQPHRALGSRLLGGGGGSIVWGNEAQGLGHKE